MGGIILEVNLVKIIAREWNRNPSCHWFRDVHYYSVLEEWLAVTLGDSKMDSSMGQELG